MQSSSTQDLQSSRGDDDRDVGCFSLGPSETGLGRTQDGDCVGWVNLSALQERLEAASTRKRKAQDGNVDASGPDSAPQFKAASLQVTPSMGLHVLV